MMDHLRAYLISVVAAAVICWVVSALLPKSGAVSAMGKFLCGVFMSVTILSPVVSLQLPDISVYSNQFSAQAQEAVSVGKTISVQALERIIKQRCEAYILDKAADFGAQLTVRVEMNTQSMPVPSAVEICGAYSPYARLRLTEIIRQELGIEEEAQTWRN